MHSSKKNRRIICSFIEFFLIKKSPLTLDDLKYIKSQTMKKKASSIIIDLQVRTKYPLNQLQLRLYCRNAALMEEPHRNNCMQASN